MNWNKETKRFDFTEAELTTSVKKNVFILLNFPEICKLIDSRRIKKTRYGYTLKAYWDQSTKFSAQAQLDKIVNKCKELNIPYSNPTIVKSGTDKELWSWWIRIFGSEEDKASYSKVWLKNSSLNNDDKRVTIWE